VKNISTVACFIHYTRARGYVMEHEPDEATENPKRINVIKKNVMEQ